ncbi:MAG TPA: ubiquinone-dependent pyruvate dehydrogenase [Thermoplasmata archaeon]|nr:ubiquinone-dependent pyruvate dehydrogenase [Thermoplasmata archaeon]
MAERVADVLVDTLVNAGVQRVYGVAGDSLNGITDSIRPRKEISWVHVRHEEAAAFAAGAEAQLTGRLAVCAGSCGPGNLHLINGLYDAHRSRAPVLAIAAQIPSPEIGGGYFQETHPDQLFRECSHYAELISQPEQMPRVLEIAMRTAVAREGVAVVAIPGDVALRAATSGPTGLSLSETRPKVCPTDAEVAKMATLLSEAGKVTVLAGAGCEGAHDAVVALAQQLKAPIVHTLRGKPFVEYSNPCDVGMTGLLGFASGYHALQAADVVLMLGTDFPYRQFYPTKATVIQVDVRGEQIGRRTPVSLGVVGDVNATIGALLPLLKESKDDRHLTSALADYVKSREGLDSLATEGGPGSKVHPQYVARVLNEIASDDAVFAVDVGTPTVWAARYLTMNGRRRLLGSFNHASMANGLPQAIGAQLAYPDRQVISMSGDGGLAMLLGELLTLHQLALPVKVVVFKNDSLAFVTLEMLSAGFLDFATDLVNPNFAALAQSAGILGLSVTSPEQVRPALTEALRHPGPALVEVAVSRQEVVLPPSIDLDLVRKFGLFVVKAVFSGRGDEVIDLAKTTFWR